MGNLPIILDLDCVVADISDLMQQAFLAETGKDIPVSAWYQYYLDEIYGVSMDALLCALVKHQVLEQAYPFAGARTTVEALQKAFPVVMCTNRSYHPDAQALTEQWLETHGFRPDALVVNAHTRCKAEACAAYNDRFSWIVDDHIGNINQALSSGRVERGALIRQPWNLNSVLREAVHEYASLQAFHDFMLTIPATAVYP
ncbi:hypothetical protein [Marinobacterium sp. BA1]|uniref:hypothetical protein n=1 Tax=Marinobacterium sp. BA1 TaxID=3138931 RepID=UPI0032E5DB49